MIGSHNADQCVRLPFSQIVIYDNFVRGRRENLASAYVSYPVLNDRK